MTTKILESAIYAGMLLALNAGRSPDVAVEQDFIPPEPPPIEAADFQIPDYSTITGYDIPSPEMEDEPEPTPEYGPRPTAQWEATPKKLIEVVATPEGTDKELSVWFVCSRTNSWSDAINTAKNIGSGGVVRDTHFNAMGGHYESWFRKDRHHYGYMVLCNTAGLPYAKALCAQFGKVYEEQGFEVSSPTPINTSRQHRLGMTSTGNSKGVAVVIEEFCYNHDPVNGSRVMEWAFTKEGQRRLAQARLDALAATEFDTEVVFAGHWGDRGDRGANYQGTPEHEWAFAGFEATFDLLNESNLCVNPSEELTCGFYDPFFPLASESPPKPRPVARSVSTSSSASRSSSTTRKVSKPSTGRLNKNSGLRRRTPSRRNCPGGI